MTANRVVSKHDELEGCGTIPHSVLDKIIPTLLTISGSAESTPARQVCVKPGIKIIDGPGNDITIATTHLFAWMEEPIGDNDGINRTFSLEHNPNPEKALMFFVNGVLQQQGETKDYTLHQNIVQLNYDYLSGSNICATYQYAQS